MVNPQPVVGMWYARPGGDAFEVVAIDRDDRTIEIQYFDGTVEELDVDEWREEEIRAAEKVTMMMHEEKIDIENW